MTRAKSIAIGMSVMIAVVAATTALALNVGFVTSSEASMSSEPAPVTTTTTYEQYLEEWYANNPTTTAAPSTTTVPPEPVIVYEYVDVPVSIPAPEVVYVTVPPTAPPESPTTTVGEGPNVAETPNTTSTSTPPSTTTTTAPVPSTTSQPAMDLLEFDMYGFATITVASHGPGDSLQFWQIEQDSPWVWEIENDNGSRVEVKFFNTASGKEAKFSLEIRSGGYKLKTEGDGFPETEQQL